MNTQERQLRKELINLCIDLSVKVLVDAPCGDVFWMQDVWEKMSGIVQVYIGCDPNLDIIEENKAHYEMEITIPKVWFEQLDIVNETLPACDMLFCGTFFGSYSTQQRRKILTNFKETRIKHFVTISDGKVKLWTKDEVNNVVSG